MNPTESLTPNPHSTPVTETEIATEGWRYHTVTVLLILVEAQYKALMFALLIAIGCLRVTAMFFALLFRPFRSKQ